MLVSTSLGAFGPLFGSDYVYNATALDVALTALGVTFPNDQLARGQYHVTHWQTALNSCYLLYLMLCVASLTEVLHQLYICRQQL